MKLDLHDIFILANILSRIKDNTVYMDNNVNKYK